MSHDTHQEQSTKNKTIVSFKNSFWLVIILVFLFIGALNFVQAESHGEEGKAEPKEKMEMNGMKEPASEKNEAKAQPNAEETKPASSEAAGK